jgi:valyl-tRNA synthetase
VDTAFDDKVFKVGRRLVTKLYNAAKFVLSQEAEVHPISHELDRAFLHELKALVDKATAAHEDFSYAVVLLETEQFFWSRFTDTYLELAKTRAWGGEGVSKEAQGSAAAALRLGLSVLLRLFAPVLPYITEEIWSWVFTAETGIPSIHGSRWPDASDFAGIEAPANVDSLETAIAAVAAINKSKSDASVSIGRAVTSLTLAASPPTLAALRPIVEDVLAATRTRSYELVEDAALSANAFVLREVTFAEAEVKPTA